MSHYSQKGYTQVRAQDPKTGQKFIAAVPKDGKVAKKYRAGVRKIEKANKQAFREFKANMKLAKKAIPLRERGKVNWSEVQVETTQTEVQEPIL